MFNLMSIRALSNLWSAGTAAWAFGDLSLAAIRHSWSMREVFTSQDFTEVGYYKSILDEAGISSVIRNENANVQGLTGSSFYPSLCVVKDEDYAEAIRILRTARGAGAVLAADWTCPVCSEKNPGNFEVCWKCSAARPSA
jgi:hypothetical protein